MHPRTLARLLVSTLILAAMAGPVAAEVNEEIDYAYYDVYHEHGESVSKAITRDTTVGKGKGFHGYTEWLVNWKFKWRYDDDSCWITDVTVDLTGTITLPELHTDDPAAQVRFDRYLEALQAHEENHLANGREAAEEIDEAIADMDARESCDELEADANALGHEIVRAANRRDKDYDKRTGHGRTEGARITD